MLAALAECLEAGRDRIEHEEAYPIFMRNYVVGYERVDDLPWMEIDFPEDVTQAEREVLPKL
jgi:choline kinase